MRKFLEFINEVKEPTGDLKKACWTGYTAVGTKKKNGKTVPNCVPEEVDLEEGMKQTLRRVVPGYAKREIDRKMDDGKFGKTDVDKDANFYRYKKIQDKLKKEETELDENHVAIAMGKEMDDEGSMIMNQLDQMERAINMMREAVKDPNMQVPAWVQSKVTLAADYIETAAGYMSSKNEEVVAEAKKVEYDIFHPGPAPNEIYVMKQIQKEKLEKEKLKKQKPKKEEVELEETAAWQRKEGKSESGGLNAKGVASYRRENPGSKLKTAVTTKPSKLKPGSAAANRRKSFCARMSGMKKRLTSAKTANDPDSRINKSLRKWNC